MNKLAKIVTFGGAAAMAACAPGQENESFKYLIDEFADIKVIRYRIPGWDELSLQQKEYAYHLSEAAKWGRDIFWDQNCQGNLELRHVLEDILEKYQGDRNCPEFQDFIVYAKRVMFANGIHHHYSEDKIFPACSQEYFRTLMQSVGDSSQCPAVLPFVFDSTRMQRRCTSSDGDIVLNSSVNFYEDGVSRNEVDAYYASVEDTTAETPVSYGLNSTVGKDSAGRIVERVWNLDSKYGPAIAHIIEELQAAAAVAENDIQKRALGLLCEYYKTGNLKTWDDFNILWVQDTLGTIDFINGFIEDYNDPLGRKGAWEGYVNVKDFAASVRTQKICDNAQWFEDHSPVDPAFKKKQCKGVSAKVVNAICISGDSYPATPIGINLPNADWIRKQYGSKSVTIANITHSYDYAAQESPRNTLDEFAFSDHEKALYRQYGAYADEVHTDLHECLGHGSGQLLPGVSSTAMGEYSSTLEEARADLFGLYFAADPKLVELGVMPSADAYKATYSKFIRNGIFEQFNRVEFGRQNTEAHMQDRKLIAQWCFEKGRPDGVIEQVVRDGKTYFVVRDYEKLRTLFGQLLAEIQRIKSTGDYQAGKALVETYAVNIDPALHREVLDRYAALGLKPYGGFINPEIVPILSDGTELRATATGSAATAATASGSAVDSGLSNSSSASVGSSSAYSPATASGSAASSLEIIDYKLIYFDDFLEQQLDYGHRYRTL